MHVRFFFLMPLPGGTAFIAPRSLFAEPSHVTAIRHVSPGRGFN